MTLNFPREWCILSEDHVEEITYTSIEGQNLRLLIMGAGGENKLQPCIIFIHGGGFSGGTAEMLLPQCRYFVRLGFVCVSVDYRLMRIEGECPETDSVGLDGCVADCKAAVRFIRKNAEKWNIDSRKIILLGESAGGYLASAVAALKDFNASEDDLSVSCIPNLLVVYNPITDLLGKWKMRVQYTPLPNELPVSHEDVSCWLARHERARRLSPRWNLTEGHPPVLVMHGLMDTVVYPEESVEYARGLEKLDVDVRLELLPKSKHAFALFNYTASDDELIHTLAITENFLKHYGYCI